MKKYLASLRPAMVCLLIFTVICGFFYTGAVTGIAQLLFPHQANGSILTVTPADNSAAKIGSALLGQEFTAAKYLIGRPTEVSNLASTSPQLDEIVTARVQWYHDLDPGNGASIPADLVYASGSGVDPYISTDAAAYQVSRIAGARDMKESAVKNIIDKYTTGRFVGIFGEPVVNVLQVNLALDGLI